VRDGKCGKDRVTVLPDSVKPQFQAHLREIRQLHQRDLESGGGRVHLPYALARRDPRQDEDALHARAQPRGPWRPESGGPPLTRQLLMRRALPQKPPAFGCEASAYPAA
jgi:hypothetical protein